MPRVDYERIGDDWPALPDVTEMRPEYAEIVYQRLLPFAEKRPLLFHVLTTLGRPSEDVEAQFLELAEAGAALAPRRDIGKADPRWGETRSMLFDLDRAAGDDRYVFTTPCNVFAASHTHERWRDIAVAFDAATVLKAHPVAFRASDLDRLFGEIKSLHGFESYQTDDEDEEPASPLDDQDIVDDVLLAADAGTQYDPPQARKLLLLYARLLSAFRRPELKPMQRPFLDGEVLHDDPERLAIYRAARQHFPGEEIAIELGRHVPFNQDSLRWGPLFGEPDVVQIHAFPELLLGTPQGERPELLVEGQLRLADAVFYRDHRQRWLTMPAELTQRARLVANPPIL